MRAVLPERGLLVLQDKSGTALLEVPQLDPKINAGDEAVLEANPCLLGRTRFGLRLGDIPTVDNGGVHSMAEKSGRIFLNAGMIPVRLDWFNGPTEFGLNLDLEGPGVPRQPIPDSSLWHDSATNNGGENLQPGLRYRAFEGIYWREMPDFSLLTPRVGGIATNFSASYRTRDDNCGLTFNGFLQIKHPGNYTFYLKSDDGSLLYLGPSSVNCHVLQPAGNALPAPENLEHALTDRSYNHWVQMEGEVTFASADQHSLEMLVGGSRVPVTIVADSHLFATNLLHRWMTVQGVCVFSGKADDNRLVGVFVLDSGQVTIRNEYAWSDASSNLLTTASQIRRLKAEEAQKHIPVKIRGVVIYASPAAAVLQDSSGGVFISSSGGVWKKAPKVGEFWEMEGLTDSGLFSPVVAADKSAFLGYAPLPEPLQPTRDQLINGNMDAEYGELHGVITSISTNEIGLLAADGKVSVMGSADRPLPELPKSLPNGGSLIGSVVRIRGCFAPMVDLQTRQVVSGKTYLYPASVEVEDPALPDPFQLPTRTPSDLMWFNARALALQRTKLTGQILYVLPGEYLVMDRKDSFRVLMPDASLEVGDLIDAVGFPRLDGPSPVLQEARVRKTGHAALPPPVAILPENLLDRELDSKLVQIKALLMSDTMHPGERVLELQSGPQHFVARLDSGPRPSALLPAGCRLQLTGVYASAYGDRDRAGTHTVPFELLLHNSANIVVLQRPPWWTIQRILILLVALSGVLGATFIWVALLRRKVEQRTAQLKREIEQRQLAEQHHAIELERTRVARDLHDELGAGLTEVGLLGSLANTPAVKPEAKGRYLDQITQLARSLVTSLDEIVWAVNPHYDSVMSLVSYFSLYAESFLNLAEINCRLRVAEEIPHCPLDSQQRHGVFCVFKEALNNVVRHSGATEAQIAFEVVNGALLLSLVDNGRGFKFVPDEPGKDGLASLQQRMEGLGGNCQITSQPGQGTSVRIFLPLNQAQHGQNSNR
ncbi:MAG TPA: ATP-binding protein [Verrucomicrobiae bacterium]|nr:ATP-binding protein [Verrucomicrobiae bacterium]